MRLRFTFETMQKSRDKVPRKSSRRPARPCEGSQPRVQRVVVPPMTRAAIVVPVTLFRLKRFRNDWAPYLNPKSSEFHVFFCCHICFLVSVSPWGFVFLQTQVFGILRVLLLVLSALSEGSQKKKKWCTFSVACAPWQHYCCNPAV